MTFYMLVLQYIYTQICGRRWDAHEEVGFCSESVKNRSIIHHIAELVSLF